MWRAAEQHDKQPQKRSAKLYKIRQWRKKTINRWSGREVTAKNKGRIREEEKYTRSRRSRQGRNTESNSTSLMSKVTWLGKIYSLCLTPRKRAAVFFPTSFYVEISTSLQDFILRRTVLFMKLCIHPYIHSSIHPLVCIEGPNLLHYGMGWKEGTKKELTLMNFFSSSIDHVSSHKASCRLRHT